MKERTPLISLNYVLIENLQDDTAIQIAQKLNVTTYKELEMLIYANNPSIITNKIILQSFLDAAIYQNISLEYLLVTGLKVNKSVVEILENNNIETYQDLEEALESGIIEENAFLRNGLEIVKKQLGIVSSEEKTKKQRILVDKQ